jgi:hypothetical protein
MTLNPLLFVWGDSYCAAQYADLVGSDAHLANAWMAAGQRRASKPTYSNPTDFAVQPIVAFPSR